MEIERIYKQLDQIEASLDRLLPELAAIKTDLAYHIKRSDLLEEKAEELEENYQKLYGFFSIGGWLMALIVAILSALHLLKVI